MTRVLVLFAVFVFLLIVLFGAIVVGRYVYGRASTAEDRRSQKSQQKALTDPSAVAEKAADAYVNNDLDSIRRTLRTAAEDWKDKDWEKFHSVRESIIEDMRARDSRLSSEMKYLEELNRKDNAIDNALNAIRNGNEHVTANAQWERMFAYELEKDKRR